MSTAASEAAPHVRLEQDAYMTPRPLADAIVGRLAATIEDPDVVVEPSAGDGAFVRAARAAWPKAYIEAVELDDRHRGKLADAGADHVEIGPWETWAQEIDASSKVLVLGNPPYSLAVQHVSLALSRMGAWGGPDKWMSLLLRAAFLTTQKRYEVLYGPLGFGGLRYRLDIVERPSFIGGGSDNSEYVAAVWNAGYRGPYVGDWLSWR